MTFSTEIEKNSKILIEPQRPQLAEVILSKKNKVEGITFPGFKIFYKAIVIKTA